MTANQLERFARAHRQVTQADDAAARVRRRLTWRLEEDGSLSGTFRLPPLAGAVLLKALRAACADLAGDPRGDVSAETPPAPARVPGDPADPARCHVEDGPDLGNLVSLCRWHHKLVHDRGYLIAAPPGASGTFAFYRPDGTPLPTSPPLPEPGGSIDAAHDADITPDTIIPPWYGERLDLHHAIWACFANARGDQQKQADANQDGDPAGRGRVTVYEPEDCDERYRQYLERTPRRAGPTLIPIQV
jgi:hypothetical protein